MNNDIHIIEDAEPGRFFFSIQDNGDDRAAALFEDRGLQGGGYTWEGVLISLLQLKMPDALPHLNIGAEADNMYAYSNDRALLEGVAELVQSAMADRQLLAAAIDNAG